MDPTPYWIMGMMVGCGLTLLIQAYGRRRVKKALAAVRGEDRTVPQERPEARNNAEARDIARRLAVLEQIVTDRPAALAEQIEQLRHEAR